MMERLLGDGTMIRLAKEQDLPGVEQVYEETHAWEEEGRGFIGWDRRIYPTRETAREALERGDLFVLLRGREVLGSAIINQRQVDSYERGRWRDHPSPSLVMVLHTLVIRPGEKGKGYGRSFVSFYEEYALLMGCPYLRMDTNAKNTNARAMYAKLGYREADVVECEFNGLADVSLVLLEKRLDGGTGGSRGPDG